MLMLPRARIPLYTYVVGSGYNRSTHFFHGGAFFVMSYSQSRPYLIGIKYCLEHPYGKLGEWILQSLHSRYCWKFIVQTCFILRTMWENEDGRYRVM